MKQIFINLWEDIKVAVKDTVDASMVVIIFILAVVNLFGVQMSGVVGFILFYTIFLLIRKAGLQRRVNELENPNIKL